MVLFFFFLQNVYIIYHLATKFFFMLKETLEENAGRRLSCRLIPNSLIRMSPVQVSEVSHDVFVDLAFERLQVIFRREHRAGKKIPLPGRSRYETALRSNSEQCVTLYQLLTVMVQNAFLVHKPVMTISHRI